MFLGLCLSECSLYYEGRVRLCNFKMCVCWGSFSWGNWLRSADSENWHTHTQTLFSVLTCELTLITCRCVQDDRDKTRPPWIKTQDFPWDSPPDLSLSYAVSLLFSLSVWSPDFSLSIAFNLLTSLHLALCLSVSLCPILLSHSLSFSLCHTTIVHSAYISKIRENNTRSIIKVSKNGP